MASAGTALPRASGPQDPLQATRAPSSARSAGLVRSRVLMRLRSRGATEPSGLLHPGAQRLGRNLLVCTAFGPLLAAAQLPPPLLRTS